MPKIKVGLGNGHSKVIEFTKPYEYVSFRDIQKKVGNERIIGWVELIKKGDA